MSILHGSTDHVISTLHNIDITLNRFYMAARIDKIVISELAATDPEKSESTKVLRST